tara:strand:- start:1387 stop:2145 length:759 start_codon:yes stop_codon:yes gene_type:complete
MTIKQNGGVFGRNPTFNDVTIDGTLTFDGDIDINSDLKIDGDLEVTGTSKLTGNVGIGKSSGSNALELQGEALFGSGTDGIKLTYSGGSSTGIIDTGYTSTGIEFRVGNVKKLVLNSSGNLEMNSGSGIDFSATAGTGTSELLDDYEEGTWTPANDSMTVNSGTFAATGTYVKIGKLVFIDVIQTSGTVSSGSGAGMISGFPFTPARTSTMSYSNGAGTLVGVGITETNSKFYGGTAFSSQTALRFSSVYTV